MDSFSLKIKLLSLLPPSWLTLKIEAEFVVSNYLVRRIRKIIIKHGVLCTPYQKLELYLSSECVTKIIDFYRNQDISSEMPYCKQFLNVREGGKRVHK